jgi:hypothetical protein
MNEQKPDNESIPITDGNWLLQKNVLNDLAKHLMKLKEIQEKYGIDDPHEIHRIRYWAIANFYSIKSELPEVTQQYLRLWAAEHHRKLVDSEQIEALSDTKSHRDDLAIKAREMVNHIKEYSGYANDWNIYDIWSNENDAEGLNLLDDPLVQDLFSHLKQDMPELSKFSSWDDMTFGDVPFELTTKILNKAAKRDFHGTCDIL